MSFEGSSGGGKWLASPIGMNDTDSIHASGARLISAMASNAALIAIAPARDWPTSRSMRALLHTRSFLRPKRSSNVVIARMIRNNMNATAEARPRFHHLKPSSYMKYSTLTVLCSGSPRVIT